MERMGRESGRHFFGRGRERDFSLPKKSQGKEIIDGHSAGDEQERRESGESPRDELFDEAHKFLLEQKFCSADSLRKRFKIEYPRARVLISQLRDAGALEQSKEEYQQVKQKRVDHEKLEKEFNSGSLGINLIKPKIDTGPVDSGTDPLREASEVKSETEDREPDEFFFEARRLVVAEQECSVALLQKRLKMGFARAVKLISELEISGVVGPFDGVNPRKVFVKQKLQPERAGNDQPAEIDNLPKSRMKIISETEPAEPIDYSKLPGIIESLEDKYQRIGTGSFQEFLQQEIYPGIQNIQPQEIQGFWAGIKEKIKKKLGLTPEEESIGQKVERKFYADLSSLQINFGNELLKLKEQLAIQEKDAPQALKIIDSMQKVSRQDEIKADIGYQTEELKSKIKEKEAELEFQLERFQDPFLEKKEDLEEMISGFSEQHENCKQEIQKLKEKISNIKAHFSSAEKLKLAGDSQAQIMSELRVEFQTAEITLQSFIQTKNNFYQRLSLLHGSKKFVDNLLKEMNEVGKTKVEIYAKSKPENVEIVLKPESTLEPDDIKPASDWIRKFAEDPCDEKEILEFFKDEEEVDSWQDLTLVEASRLFRRYLLHEDSIVEEKADLIVRQRLGIDDSGEEVPEEEKPSIIEQIKSGDARVMTSKSLQAENVVRIDNDQTEPPEEHVDLFEDMLSETIDDEGPLHEVKQVSEIKKVTPVKLPESATPEVSKKVKSKLETKLPQEGINIKMKADEWLEFFGLESEQNKEKAKAFLLNLQKTHQYIPDAILDGKTAGAWVRKYAESAFDSETDQLSFVAEFFAKMRGKNLESKETESSRENSAEKIKIPETVEEMELPAREWIEMLGEFKDQKLDNDKKTLGEYFQEFLTRGKNYNPWAMFVYGGNDGNKQFVKTRIMKFAESLPLTIQDDVLMKTLDNANKKFEELQKKFQSVQIKEPLKEESISISAPEQDKKKITAIKRVSKKNLKFERGDQFLAEGKIKDEIDRIEDDIKKFKKEQKTNDIKKIDELGSKISGLLKKKFKLQNDLIESRYRKL